MDAFAGQLFRLKESQLVNFLKGMTIIEDLNSYIKLYGYYLNQRSEKICQLFDRFG